MDKLSPFDLTDRVVLLTGAAGHLGSAMAIGLANAGCRLVLNGRNRETLAALSETITSDGSQAYVLPFDVTDTEAVSSALTQVRREIGRLDVLINNAYSGHGGTIAASCDDDFEKSYSISVTAAASLVREARPLLEEAGQRNPGGASVINIASMYGVVSPDPRIYSGPEQCNPPFYGSAKAALIQLSRSLACELAPCHIRVNSISPGPFPSPSVQRGSPEMCKQLASRVPLGRIGNPRELIGPVVFLASDASSYVTGHNLLVDGGWTVW